MNNTLYKWLLPTMAVILLACGTESGYETTANGMKIKYFTKLNGRKPVTGDEMQFRMEIWAVLNQPAGNKTDSMVHNTSEIEVATGHPATTRLQAGKYKGNIFDAFAMAGKGDSIEFQIPADTFFLYGGKGMPPFVKSGTALTFRMKMLDVIPKDEVDKRDKLKNDAMQKKAEESVALHEKQTAEYLAANHLIMDSTASGLRYRYLKKGNGPVCQPEDGVEMAYKGYFFSGKVFDQNENFRLVAGVQQVIRGWDEILCLMKQGDKVQVIIPFWLAYGEQQMGEITPYSTLIFDMELKKLIPQPNENSK